MYGSPTTRDLKKPYSSRWVGEAEMGAGAERTWCESSSSQWEERSHIHMWWIKIRKDTWGVSDPSPRPDHEAQGSSARKIKSHNF